MKILATPLKMLGDLISSIAKPETRKSSLILLGSIIGSCLLCLGAASIIGDTDPSGTPTPGMSEQDIINNAVQGIQQNLTLTAAALPTLTIPPTETFTPLPTNTSAPTNTSLPTHTFTPLPTATIIIVFPTQPPAQAVCSCSGDTYNCTDFSTHNQAQACFNYCVQQGAGDIHRLDRDGNGSACESLP